ncbi:MAG: hypothetical protein FJW35_10930 [Acidobacteria bacterium]|nr:hypothetical protein [Acidobacteriota bacterium]
MPEAVTGIKQAKDYAPERVDEARRQLRSGRITDCVRTVSAVIAMVITPMPAPGGTALLLRARS